jgi:hypothetical protein
MVSKNVVLLHKNMILLIMMKQTFRTVCFYGGKIDCTFNKMGGGVFHSSVFLCFVRPKLALAVLIMLSLLGNTQFIHDVHVEIHVFLFVERLNYFTK